jgi:hypothetical protein
MARRREIARPGTVCQKGEQWSPLPFLAQCLTTLIAVHKLTAYDPVAASEALAAAAMALPENTEAKAQYAAISVELAGLQPHRLLH